MREVEAKYNCFIPQDNTSLNTNTNTLQITPLGTPQAREALGCHNERSSGQILVLSQKVIRTSSSRQSDRPQFGPYCHADYYQEYVAVDKRKNIPCCTCSRNLPPPQGETEGREPVICCQINEDNLVNIIQQTLVNIVTRPTVVSTFNKRICLYW